MATKTISWSTGTGSVTATYNGSGDGTIQISSDPNSLYENRSMQITVKTTDNSISKTITVSQAAKSRIDISTATVTASNQTYSGSAKTPTPTVTLNGTTIPSTGYDVSYSNNTNAGTATITVTGKGDYTGTTTGSFTINTKALTITAVAQTVQYGTNISRGTAYVTSSGLVSGDNLTQVFLTQSTHNVTTTGTITPSNAQTTKGIGNYSVTYNNGNLTINKATGTISFGTTAFSVGYDAGATGTLYARLYKSGWVKTTDKTVNGYNIYKSVSNYHYDEGTAIMKLWFYNTTGSAVNTTFKLGPATESSYDYSYITAWNAPEVTGSTVPSDTIAKVTTTFPEWTDVPITIPTGTNYIQIVYRKDSDGNNAPDCGYVAIPYDISYEYVSLNRPVYTGSGSITWSSNNTSVVSVDSSTGELTVNAAGTATITASMDADTNYTAASATYTVTVEPIIPIGNATNFAYTGTVQSKALPKGTYKLQCWGAQGGSNAANSTYGITAQAGGKGGYSEGVLTVSGQTTIYAFVGGQGGSSGNGGWNCGGGSKGSDSKTSGNTETVSRFGCGGGATDMALVTSSMSYSSYQNNRSSASLLSRMIVAGGGSGGSMCYRKVTTSPAQSASIAKSSFPYVLYTIPSAANPKWNPATGTWGGYLIDISSYRGWNLSFTVSTTTSWAILSAEPVSGQNVSYATGCSYMWTASCNMTVPSDAMYLYINSGQNQARVPSDLSFTKAAVITESTISQAGYAGGGTTGGGYNDALKGKQNAAGTFAGFGYGATDYSDGSFLYQGAAGGAGWYGGGYNNSNASDWCVRASGGGSGFVNTAANASYRPSGYTGLQLDSGTTKAGNTSFEAPGGGNETGHAGNGYARITRLS